MQKKLQWNLVIKKSVKTKSLLQQNIPRNEIKLPETRFLYKTRRQQQNSWSNKIFPVPQSFIATDSAVLNKPKNQAKYQLKQNNYTRFSIIRIPGDQQNPREIFELT
eukprot:TRINITY_DN1063_c1_g1_i1.p3 TRINITY_DN1063_c1_g1~~TRINITY_DN1063_c1_g1_i1.p3  ORF type:complete len:107 (+),score=6.77 TRINITY_DN1063_c1_g1_i1:76-396(+)